MPTPVHRSPVIAALIALLLLLPSRAHAATAVTPAGRFYTEAGGSGGLGFVVADGPAGQFWTGFRTLGGATALGYPASALYARDGFTYQATQGALLQWRPELGRVVLANTFELLSAAGDDPSLYAEHQIPLPIADDGSGGDYARAVSTRLSWLTDPGIARRFMENPDPASKIPWTVDLAIARYGLPMSRPEAFGPFVSQRFQRITFQRWTKAVPGMPAPGTVVNVLGGDLAKATDFVPWAAQQPRPAPPAGATPSELQGPVVVATAIPTPPPPPGEPAPTAEQLLGDLLRSAPEVDEHALNKEACGVAATAMLVDYYLARSGGSVASADLHDVAGYVPEWYFSDKPRPGGTSFPELQDGVQRAATAYGVPLSARWERAPDPAAWRATLGEELDRGHPVIVFLTDGGMLWGGRWHYGHFVVVSSLTSGGGVLYHDPWDGKAHVADDATFRAAWATSADDSPAWTFLRATPIGERQPPAAPEPRLSAIEQAAGTESDSPTLRVSGSGFVPGDTVTLDATRAAAYVLRNPTSPNAAPVVCRPRDWTFAPIHVTADTAGGFAATIRSKANTTLGGSITLDAVGARSGLSDPVTVWAAAATVTSIPAGC